MFGRISLVGSIERFHRNTDRVIIDYHTLLFINDVHGGTDRFVLQEDNCGPHSASSVAIYLQKEELTRMKWLAQSHYGRETVSQFSHCALTGSCRPCNE